MVRQDQGSSEDWLGRVARMRVWKKNEKRAPHKPLLLLCVLARIQDGSGSKMAYEDCKPQLEELLGVFAPPRRNITTADPFVRLANDGLWIVTTEDGSEPRPNRAQLLKSHATGQLIESDEELLVGNPGLLRETAIRLLGANWPESLHEEICSRLGLDLSDDTSPAPPSVPSNPEVEPRKMLRDPKFRPLVLRAYEYRCAMCGWDGRLGSKTVALEAAHLRWKQYGGADNLQNGLCLCILHHKLLDLGALGLSDEGDILVSEEFVEGRPSSAAEEVIQLTDKSILPPQRSEDRPAAKHAEWHRKEVFRGPARGNTSANCLT